MAMPFREEPCQRRWGVGARGWRKSRARTEVVVIWFAAAFGAQPAHAADREMTAPVATEHSGPIENAVPVVALAATAFGETAHHYGAAALGRATAALSGSTRSDSRWGGGFRLWGSPFERLTFIGEGMRRDNGELAPSLAMLVRLFEDDTGSWALGALGRYKAEGFAEVEGEIELGLIGSYARGPAHLDLDLVAGRGFEEEETDAEILARAGYDVVSSLRVGVEGQYRHRFGGDARLPGGKDSDIFAGAELSLSFEPMYAAVLMGPTTVGVVDGVGLGGLLTLGGVM
jgi:hypothetical protein